MPTVRVECVKTLDPPYVLVTVSVGGQDIYAFSVPYAGYADVANALNLPGNPCDE